MSIRSMLYKVARIIGDVKSLKSPQAMARRVKNKLVGRALNKMKIWR